MARFYRQMEARYREELAAPNPIRGKGDIFTQQVAASTPANVERLKERYFKDRNPVHVWNAIMQLHGSAQFQALPLVLPIWVMAYLVTAASGIMGRAVKFPEAQMEVGEGGRKIRKSRVPEPVPNPKGGVTRFSDWFGGATAPERIDAANEALGFTTIRGGANPFLRAHRDDNDAQAIRELNAGRAQGMTITAAAEQISDPQFKKAGDRTRKLRRARHRLGSGET